MKVVLLAGGRGSRLGALTDNLPKPLVPVAGRPMLWHIIEHYLARGCDDCLVAAGYRAGDLADAVAASEFRDRVRVVDTGPDTATGGRLLRLAPLLDQGTFLMTYADAIADVDVGALLAFHQGHGRLATVTAVNPPSRFGHLSLAGDAVRAFEEKPVDHSTWINGGHFVLEKGVLELIADDLTAWERGPMQQLARRGELRAYRHRGFWRCVDTPDDLAALEETLREPRRAAMGWPG
jgi:glucose-1-phosphate cytidylyltransferase